MRRKIIESTGMQQARRHLAQLIDEHLKRGQRSDGTPEQQWQPWTNEDFAAAVEAAPSSVGNWRNRERPIPPTKIIRVLDVFFGDNPKFLLWRKDLREAWDRATGLIPPASGEQEEPSPRSDWTILQPNGTDGLVELHLHQPRPSNMTNSFYLDGTLIAGMAEHDWENQTVVIGLRKAVLAIDSPSHQPSKGSMIGERAVHECARRIAGGVEFNPCEGRDCLTGDLLGDDYIAVMEPAGEGEPEVTVQLYAGRRSFEVAAVDGQPDGNGANITEEKDAVLNALIYTGRPKDGQGRVMLAWARIQNKPPT
jgi:hypothetical protein